MAWQATPCSNCHQVKGYDEREGEYWCIGCGCVWRDILVTDTFCGYHNAEEGEENPQHYAPVDTINPDHTGTRIASSGKGAFKLNQTQMRTVSSKVKRVSKQRGIMMEACPRLRLEEDAAKNLGESALLAYEAVLKAKTGSLGFSTAATLAAAVVWAARKKNIVRSVLDVALAFMPTTDHEEAKKAEANVRAALKHFENRLKNEKGQEAAQDLGLVPKPRPAPSVKLPGRVARQQAAAAAQVAAANPLVPQAPNAKALALYLANMLGLRAPVNFSAEEMAEAATGAMIYSSRSPVSVAGCCVAVTKVLFQARTYEEDARKAQRVPASAPGSESLTMPPAEVLCGLKAAMESVAATRELSLCTLKDTYKEMYPLMGRIAPARLRAWVGLLPQALVAGRQASRATPEPSATATTSTTTVAAGDAAAEGQPATPAFTWPGPITQVASVALPAPMALEAIPTSPLVHVMEPVPSYYPVPQTAPPPATAGPPAPPPPHSPSLFFCEATPSTAQALLAHLAEPPSPAPAPAMPWAVSCFAVDPEVAWREELKELGLCPSSQVSSVSDLDLSHLDEGSHVQADVEMGVGMGMGMEVDACVPPCPVPEPGTPVPAPQPDASPLPCLPATAAGSLAGLACARVERVGSLEFFDFSHLAY